ncbi:DUF4011 domain-containing protein [Actinoplanes sp. TRM 88003]|uniref:DUF4011 domain-containing protein n=1 Tax=Paractinoplanes aksuensis TaxID=2939490 RepID=A0ABT1DRV2_9ACTN|nr:DUF4011 domain-containing protein [Actinoplanes aksuensis]MCO8273571.1 DUF4011 domain-containing protein [Actinoplanes aksuensis]
MTHDVFTPVVLHAPGLEVHLLLQPAINLALVHNRVAPVRQLLIGNAASEPAQRLEVRLDIIGPDGPLGEAWHDDVPEISPGAAVAWDHLGSFGPDTAVLRNANEAFPVDYRINVARLGHPDFVASVPSRALAHDEWFNHPLLYDSLAAFVQPNTEAVDAVLRSAGQILVATTGSGSMEGYQNGSKRAAQIAGAVYEALRQLGIHYRGLPASFENTGQKIRTTAAVLESRLGNCVDMSVTYAACLEQAGLRPLIWMIRGHAFAGFLAAESHLPAPVVTEENLLISMVESGRAVPVEVTATGPGSESLDFTRAVRAGLTHFRKPRGTLLGVIDVHSAHCNGVRPLPTRDSLPQLPVPVDTGAPARVSIELPPGAARDRLDEQAADEAVPQENDESPPRIQQWKRALLDLSLRNPLLSLPARGKGLQLHVPAGALALLDDLVHAGKRLEVIPHDQISHIHQLAGARGAQDLDPETLIGQLRDDLRIYGAVDEKRYRSAMRGLQREARTMEQETGSNYLYLTIGTLVHPKPNGSEAYAPLFLLPVRIDGGVGHQPYSLVVDGTQLASPNQCLVEWLRVRHGVKINELENPLRDEHGIDIPATLAAIRDNLVGNRLNYRIDETASLRLLQFSTFQLWRDLRDHWPVFMESPVVRHLVESTGATFDDPAGDPSAVVIDESRLHLPIPADGSQMQAVELAKRGYSFVLEGPPGTGKSQTITNLIATAVASGRTVLFVAEKQAALEVVKGRLTSIGLAPFGLDLHGRTQSIEAIREQLTLALEQDDRGDGTAWTAVETAYRTKLSTLARYPERLHAANGAGLTAWSAFEAVLTYGEGPTADVPPAYLEVAAAYRDQVEHHLQDFAAVARSARLRRDHPWSLSGLRAVGDLTRDQVHQIAQDLERVRADLLAQPGLADCVRELAEPDELEAFRAAAHWAAAGRLPDHASTRRAMEPGWDEAVTGLRADLARVRRDHGPELALFQPAVLAAPDLPAWQADAVDAAKRMFGKRRALQKVADQLTPFVHEGQVVPPDQVADVLGRLLQLREHADDLHRRVAALGALRLPPGWLAVGAQAEDQLAQAHQAAVIGRDLLRQNAKVWEVLAAGVDPTLVDRIVAAWAAWRTALHSGPAEFASWSAEPGWYDSWQRDGARWLAELAGDGLLGLQRWAGLLVNTDALIRAGLTTFRRQLLQGEISAETAEEAYRRGLARTALAERMRAGDLEYFDPVRHDNDIVQFQKVAAGLRTALPDHLPSVLVDRRPFRPTERRGRVADLATELRRKRGGKSFRELFTQYSDVILALTPCVLVSPASAATFLAPGAARFDIVIFDEASQIRVPEAIGAMGRGRATVIVGDSRQMPPTSGLQLLNTDDTPPGEEDPVPEDLDSILSEAVESGLPQRWLSWHYRSHDESLIAFSNRYYYESKLSSMPSPGSADTAGVHWRRVNGRYDRGATRTNKIEAEAIVAEIVRRVHDPVGREHSIGVVTFNLQQRNEILDRLEQHSDPLVRERVSAGRREPIFVKNLENVQGDERDVILFSLAFSTDPDTGRLPLNFGPLSQTGGERRLNVAITRARRQVVLFASFDPGDIDLARTTSIGTQHLRAYCEMAAVGTERLGDLSITRRHNRDRIRDEVATALSDRGLEVTTCHGLSEFTVDIAVRTPGAPRWQVAVMLDGPQWGKRPTVADRDDAPRLLHLIMGWPEVVRFWLPAWIRDRAAVLDSITAAVDRAVDRQAAPEPAIEPEPTIEPVPAVVEEHLFVPYVPTPLGDRADLDLLGSDAAVQETVRTAIREVVAAEGPVEQHRLARLVLARFGFAKSNPDRRAAVLSQADPELFRSHESAVFAWPPELDAEAWRGYRRTQKSSDRGLEDIAPEEIANAAHNALAVKPGLTEEDLLRSTLELLGYRRMTEKIERLLRYGLETGQKTGAVVRNDDGSYVS